MLQHVGKSKGTTGSMEFFGSLKFFSSRKFFGSLKIFPLTMRAAKACRARRIMFALLGTCELQRGFSQDPKRPHQDMAVLHS